MNKMKRFVASLLALVMILSLVPMSALAADGYCDTHTDTDNNYVCDDCGYPTKDVCNYGCDNHTIKYPYKAPTCSEPGQYMVVTCPRVSTDYIVYPNGSISVYTIGAGTIEATGEHKDENGDGQCDGCTEKTQTVVVNIYRNGDTENVYKSAHVNGYFKGDTLDTTSLNIADYYTSANGFEFEGWFNDGGWNQYKAGKNPAGLSEITINGWTNICCMVTDYQKVVVKAVVNGDKDNAETIFNGKALKGENLVSWLDENAEVADRTGYKLDKWYNWDWYGHKFGEDVTVNGWTNVYVTFDAITYRIKYVGGEGSVYVGSEGSCKADQDWVIINGYTYDEPVTLNSGEYFSRPGRSVIGWTNGGTTYAVGETVEKNFTSVQNGMVTMNAVWSDCTHENTKYDIVEANCAEEGTSKVICKDCGATVSEETLPKTEDHYYKDGVCRRCGAEEPKPCTHENTKQDIVEANCAEEGTSKVICKDCGETISEETLPKTEDHYYKDGVCRRCGAEEPKPCTHENTKQDIVEANCAEEGVSKVICKDCGETISEETLPKTENHFYKDGVCRRCGAEEPVAECDHDYEVVKELAPTCTEAGYVWKKCTLCGNEYNHEVGEIDPDAHNYEVVKELAPTCTEAGYVWEKCTLCGNEYNHEVGEIDPDAHNYVDTVIDPTCCADGYTLHKCSECGDYYHDNETDATGEHTYEDGCTAEKPVESVPATPVKPAVPSWVKFWNWMFRR